LAAHSDDEQLGVVGGVEEGTHRLVVSDFGVCSDAWLVLMRHGVGAAENCGDPARCGFVVGRGVGGSVHDAQWHAAQACLGRGPRNRPRSYFGAIGADDHFRGAAGLVLIHRGGLSGCGTWMLPGYPGLRQDPLTPWSGGRSRDQVPGLTRCRTAAAGERRICGKFPNSVIGLLELV
jgi:hypothetical protein